MRQVEQLIEKAEGGFDGAGGREDLGVGDDANEAFEGRSAEAERFDTLGQIRQPSGVARMVRRVLAMGVDEDVDVEKEHLARLAIGGFVVSGEERRGAIKIKGGVDQSAFDRDEAEWLSRQRRVRLHEMSAQGVFQQSAQGDLLERGPFFRCGEKRVVNRHSGSHKSILA